MEASQGSYPERLHKSPGQEDLGLHFYSHKAEFIPGRTTDIHPKHL